MEAQRTSLGETTICSKCFQTSNISAVLVDDGLRMDKMHELEWHRQYFPNVYRVLRIETVAEDILNEGPPGGITWTLDSFLERFMSSLKKLSERVVAFKSIAAYRGGLNIDPLVSKQSAEDGLLKILHSGGPVHITDKSFGDLIFLCGLEVATSCGIPMQLHTGFGDKDLDLRFSNPLHLRPVLEDKRFSKSHIVLLHTSYPFSKEASYLASVYTQVYLDFGLAVPKLSFHGMRLAVNELLELAPLNRVMFSTDGCAFPETFFLGVKWAREILLHVLSEACTHGDLLFEEALKAADDILRNNALSLYKLELQLQDTSQGSKERASYSYNSLARFSQSDSSATHVRLLWVDGSGQRRCRVVPKDRFETSSRTHGVGLAKCCMALCSYIDAPAEGCGFTPAGEIRLMPDMRTLQGLPWSPNEELALVDMHLEPGTPWECCPRSTLKRLSDILQTEFGLVMKAGFESEFYILKPSSETNIKWVALDSTTYCSSTSFDGASGLLLEITNTLRSMGVTIEQLHAEGGGGQFELALQYSPCLKAADDVVLLRETVKALIQRHGLLATFLPKYFKNDHGSGSHVHLSLWQGDKNIFMADPSHHTRFGISKIGEEFMAGVFHHLPSILAFTAPLPTSYDRIKPDMWAGAYHFWGRENREAPLRACCPPGTSSTLMSNFELKSFDGCANPHLGLAAVIAAGLDGLRMHLQLPEPIDENPSSLKEGMVAKLPNSLDEVVAALQVDEVIKKSIGIPLVNCIIAIRNSEIGFYQNGVDISDMLAFRY